MSLEEATTAVVPSPGAILRQARERANLSKEEVAGKLKLSVRQIAAIETGDWSVLPERTFTRGFMRNYARLVNVDPDTLRLDQSTSQPHAATELKPTPAAIGEIAHEADHASAGPARWLVPAALVAVLAAGVAYVQWGHLIGLPGLKPTAPAAAPGAANRPAATPPPASKSDAGQLTSGAIIAPPTPSAAAPAGAPAADNAAAAVPSLITSTNLPAPPAATGQADTAAATKAAPQPSLAPGQKRITLTFKGKSWTEVRSKGDVIFSETAAPGTREFAGAPPLSFTVGNASNVTVLIDGKPYDMSEITRNDVARFRIE
jgi:cytoskeleton protein RodZ